MSIELSLNTVANMYNAYGATLNREITDLEYYNWAKAHHHTHEDFEDGDIEERIEAYPRYVPPGSSSSMTSTSTASITTAITPKSSLGCWRSDSSLGSLSMA